jgi:hypothetical protein
VEKFKEMNPWEKLDAGGRMILKETEWQGVDWVYLSQNKDKWRAVVNMAMNFRVR